MGMDHTTWLYSPRIDAFEGSRELYGKTTLSCTYLNSEGIKSGLKKVFWRGEVFGKCVGDNNYRFEAISMEKT